MKRSESSDCPPCHYKNSSGTWTDSIRFLLVVSLAEVFLILLPKTAGQKNEAKQTEN